MIDPIALQLGPFSIRWYALCIVTGLMLAVYLASQEGPRKGISADDVTDFILLAFPLAIVGARLYYVLFSWSDYRANFLEIFAIWHGGLAIYGGLLAGAAVLFAFSYYRLINVWDFLDVAAPSVLLAQSIGRWGNFFNQEAYGKAVAQLPYLPAFIREQMYIEGSYRVPTFLYESLWTFLGFLLIIYLRRRPGWLKQGEIVSFYLVWYGCGRFVIEGLRTDSLMWGGLRVSQWLSLALVLLGLGLVIIRRRQAGLPYYLAINKG